ncbi:MAG: hypothetical protein MUE50_12305 [Pirellulaceae bacterium]|jgi:hypothetical protein|nr:hypothetical protein [Pirellulaceae bacterium]MCU0982340.1 hypothetical protein [Pirellulaceae bacterium]
MSQRYTRRQFVQAVSAAIAAPTIISATALGAEQRLGYLCRPEAELPGIGGILSAAGLPWN